MKPDRFCCDGLCKQARGECPLLPTHATLVSLNRHKRWADPYDDPSMEESSAKDFDHDRGPGVLSSRWFWALFLVFVGLGSWVAWNAISAWMAAMGWLA